jgi:hypothetical protein
MARKTMVQEAEQLLTRFFAETKAGIMADVMKTRQPTRRNHLLAELDAFDKVEGRYYHWLTSLGGDK